MAKIIVKTKIDNNKVDNLIDQIHRTCEAEPNLSPRPKKELQKAYANNRLLIATDGASIVGWLLIIIYDRNFQELASGYVIESYRSKGVFNKLLQKAFEFAPVSSIVTFNYSFVSYLLNKVGFKKSSLWEAIKLSRGKFLLNRLSISRIKAIRNHYQTARPIYAVFIKQ